MVELEEITEDEAKTHPHRNVLLRAIGQMEPYRPDIQTHQIPRQGRMLLCSDGLWAVVPENEIFRIVNGGSNLSMVCQSLVEAANNAGGPDNISVIVVEFAGYSNDGYSGGSYYDCLKHRPDGFSGRRTRCLF